VATTAATSGCYLAAIPRYKEIERPVTISEMAGRWVLTAESQRTMAIDGFTNKVGEEFAITLKPDGSCSYGTVLERAYVEMDHVLVAANDRTQPSRACGVRPATETRARHSLQPDGWAVSADK